MASAALNRKVVVWNCMATIGALDPFSWPTRNTDLTNR